MISKYLVGTFEQNTFRYQHTKMDFKRLRKIEEQRIGNLSRELFRKTYLQSTKDWLSKFYNKVTGTMSPVDIYQFEVKNENTRQRKKSVQNYQ